MKLSLYNLSPKSRCWTVARLALSLLVAGLASRAPAQTVISTSQSTNGWNFFNAYDSMVSWTQTSTHSQVSISAMLNGSGNTVGGTTAGTFYLMTQVGPNTTTANELARSSFSVSTLGMVPLFTGLTLGPGTYYLVGSGSGPGGWELSTVDESVVTAPGVSLNINNFLAEAYNPYAPANSFSSHNYIPELPYAYNLEFLVQEVPEPAPGTLLAAGLMTMLVLVSIRARSPLAKAANAAIPSRN